VERVVKLLVVALLLLLGGIHLGFVQQERRARGVSRISTPPGRVIHDVFPRGDELDHALTLTFPIDLSTTTSVELAPEVRITGGPVAVDVLDHPVTLTVNGNRIEFAPPPPAFGAVRQLTIAFSTAMPKSTYGWSHRAVALPWVNTISPTMTVQAHTHGATTAPGWRCTEDETGRVCALEARRRRALAIPIERVDDTKWKLALGLFVAAAITALMFAIYRRWAAHAERMVTPGEEIDPFDAVALMARGITAVLGLLASVFFVSFFEDGFFPLAAPFALSIWCAVAGITIVASMSRPWPALALICFTMMIALAPAARFVLPGVLPLTLAVAMQLTAGKQPRASASGPTQ